MSFVCHDLLNLSGGGEKGDDLIRVLRELTYVQRKIAVLQVELHGRKEDKNVAHLTHVSEMEKKIENLLRITTILKDPYSLDYIPVEVEYQVASYYGALTTSTSVADFQWTQNFKEPPSVWGVQLVAKGFTQTPRVDYDETFSPVDKIKSIRVMLAIAAFHDYETWQMDVKTPFLYGKLAEDV
uniref:Reverse transcriptase Ty1/copia-type domain-containing protein n=1 Tax=Lactuca sativa TaxID=4236 RepID=A0A9R1WDI6_LACSA|nr:hypothetical protein LSAT_V11C200057370 [Lactuca sativa]